MSDESWVPFTPTLFGGCFLCDGRPEILVFDEQTYACSVALCRVCCREARADRIDTKLRRLLGEAP
jgi:hypothetical protein